MDKPQMNDKPQIELQPLDEDNQRLQANVAPTDWVNPETNGRYHMVVIGAGTAGLVAAAGAAGLGAKVALIERNLMGGDCLNVGCVPSKGLIAASRAAHAARGQSAMGISVTSDPIVDFQLAILRMRRLRADISPNDSYERFTSLGVDVYQGDAEFVGDDSIHLRGNSGDRTLSFRRAVIATGAKAAAPPIPGIDSVEYLTNESLFSITELPKSMAIVGGGPIGCEMAQAFARFGTKITLFANEKGLLPNDDSAAGAIIQSTFESEGVTVRKDGKQISLSPSDQDSINISGPEGVVKVEKLLIAVGRTPNIDGLGLEKVGVEYDRRIGVKVNKRLQTTHPKIFAAGDICSTAKFTHAADFQARTVVRNALMPWPLNRADASKLVIPWATYTDPEVAGVGLTESQAAEQGVPVDVYTQDFADLDRAILEGVTEGYAKILTAKGTDKIVGAAIVSPAAGDMIGELSVAMTHGIGLGKLASAIHPYPTLGESLRKLGDQYNRTKLTPLAKAVFRKWFAWTR